jgi:DNA polymerase IV
LQSAMPLRTAAKLCPQAIFVVGHPERYRECSEQVFQV